MRVGWIFYDPVEDETYVWDVNPNEGGSPAIEKSLSEIKPTGSDGKTLFYQGVNESQKLEFSGIILSESQYDTMVEWTNKNRQLLLTDDLGREFRVIVTRFVPQRQRRARNRYYHTYSMTCLVME